MTKNEQIYFSFTKGLLKNLVTSNLIFKYKVKSFSNKEKRDIEKILKQQKRLKELQNKFSKCNWQYKRI